MHRTISDNRSAISALCQRFNVRALEVFGSAADDGFDAALSDVDLLVEFARPTRLGPLEEYFGLCAELEALLGRRVDLVELSAARNPFIRQGIELSRKPLYAA